MQAKDFLNARDRFVIKEAINAIANVYDMPHLRDRSFDSNAMMDALKEIYNTDGNMFKDLVYRDNPFLKLIKK